MSILTEQLTIAEMQNRMLRTINESVALYSGNTSLRALDSGGTCSYFDERTGNMCAVGRCLIDAEEVAENWGDAEDLLCGYGDYQTSGQSMFKPEYQGLPLAFWVDLQHWHDDENLWTDNQGIPAQHGGYNPKDCLNEGHAVQCAAQELRDKVNDGAYTRPE